MIVLEIWAAIDIRQGRVVTLRKGNPADAQTWDDSPLAAAERWEREGATGLHIVDLDGAFSEGSNLTAVESISRKSGIPVQVGGGIRTVAQAKALLDLGMARVILGTVAYNEPSVLKAMLPTLGPEKIVVALDYRNTQVVTKGWTSESSLNVLDALEKLEDSGVKTVLATAVEYDGTALGPDIETLRKLRASTRMKILASGGIRNLTDIRELEALWIDGAVVGKALYEGTLHLSEISQRA